MDKARNSIGHAHQLSIPQKPSLQVTDRGCLWPLKKSGNTIDHKGYVPLSECVLNVGSAFFPQSLHQWRHVVPTLSGHAGCVLAPLPRCCCVVQTERRINHVSRARTRLLSAHARDVRVACSQCLYGANNKLCHDVSEIFSY